MPEIKCPLCGATFEKSSTCPHCHHDVIEIDNKDIVFSINMRNSGRFHKATEVLENLLRNNTILPEVYFQLLLCEYGVFFNDDRDQISSKFLFAKEHNDSVFNKSNYQLLINYLKANPEHKEYYEKLIQQLESERVSSLNKPQVEKFDAYICYKRGKEFTHDYETAKKLYDKLTGAGIKTCFNEYNSDLVAELEVINNVHAFFLIAASPTEKDYLSRPWINLEYKTFYDRMMTSSNNYLRFYPIYNNGFTQQELPELIRNVHEGFKFDYKFDDVFQTIITDLVGKDRKSNFKKIDLKPIDRTLEIPQVNFTRKTIYKFEDSPLSSLDNTDYTIAIADMNVGTRDKFESAYQTLSRISVSNPHSLLVNVAKLKCSLLIKESAEIENAVLRDIPNIIRFQDDFIHVMEINTSQSKNYLNSLGRILYSCFEKDGPHFFSHIKLNDNLLKFYISLTKDDAEAYKLISAFLDKIRNLITLGDLTALNLNEVRYLLEHYVKPIYFANGVTSTSTLVDTYLGMMGSLVMYQKKDQLPFITYLLDEVLAIDKYNPRALWNRFLIDINCLFSDDPDHIATSLKKKNFIEIDINNPKLDEKKNKTNMYYVVLRMVQAGYKFDFFEKYNIFVTLLATVLRMINYSSKIHLAMSISNLLMSLSLREKIDNSRFQAIIVSIADRLLIEQEYKTAQLYYEEALLLGESRFARWGLVKCELKCPTNYGLLFTNKPLNESQAFRNLIALLDKNGQKSNEYMSYYGFLEEIKRGKHGKDLANAFAVKQQSLLNADFPMDDSPSAIMSNIRTSGEEFKKETFMSRFYSDRNSFIKSNVIFGVVSMLAIAISMVFFRPEIVLGISLLVFLLFVIGRKANWKIVTNKAGRFAQSALKGLYVVFAVLSLYLPYVVFTIMNRTTINALMANNILWEPMRSSAMNLFRIAAISFLPIRFIHVVIDVKGTQENTYYSEMPKFIIFNLMMTSFYLTLMTACMSWINNLPNDEIYNLSLIILLALGIMAVVFNVLLLFFHRNINFILNVFGKKGGNK